MPQIRLNESSTVNADRAAVPILELDHLVVRFGKSGKKNDSVVALNDVSLDIRTSEIVSIVGESGSGKTTLARCVLALQIPSGGSIKFQGTKIAGIRGKSLKAYRQQVQMIYQDPFESLNPRHTVFTTLYLPMHFLLGEKDVGKILQREKQLLAEVGLDPDDVIDKFPHQLSGGQRQRVNIARALVSNPTLLVADEPISMLDAAQRIRVLSLLRDLKSKRGLTIIMISHDLATAKLTSDWIVVLYRGKLVEKGRTQELLTNPHHPYVSLMLESMPTLEGEARPADESQSTAHQDDAWSGKGCIFYPRCKYGTDVCVEEEPRLGEMSDSHFVACHHPLNFD